MSSLGKESASKAVSVKNLKTKKRIEKLEDFFNFVSRKSQTENFDAFLRKGNIEDISDLRRIGGYFLNVILGIKNDEFLPYILPKNKDYALLVPQSENIYPWALFVTSTKVEDLREFFDKNILTPYIHGETFGDKKYVVATNLKEIAVFDCSNYLNEYGFKFEDLHDYLNFNGDSSDKRCKDANKAWSAFLDEFGEEKSKEKKKEVREKAIQPKEATAELSYIKRHGHLPSGFETPIGYDKSDFRNTFKTKESPFLVTEKIDWDGKAKDFQNRLIWGDNLAVMRQLPSESIDLIYIDPPFFSGRNYNCIFGDNDELRTFKDIWEGGMPTYLAWMNARLWEMKRLLKPTGSILVHLDWHACHYVKCELDKMLGYDNFINEIIWCYGSGGSSKKYFSKKHDTILVYSKTKSYNFNPVKEKSYMKEGSGKNPKQTYYDEIAKNCKADKGKKCKKSYTLVNSKDWFEIGMLATSSKERLGYPTQKPEALLERIIKSFTDKGDVVADFFSGGSTTVAVAEKLGRKWIGVDVSRVAVSVGRDRLLEVYNKKVGIDPINKKATHGFEVENHGAYEKDDIKSLGLEEYRDFILECFQAEINPVSEYIHGFKGERPVYASNPKEKLQPGDIDEFHEELVHNKFQNGTILTWNPSKEVEKRIAELRSGKSGVEIQLVTVKVVDIDSHEFTGGNIRFYHRPVAVIHATHIKGRTWKFDGTASEGRNGEDIHYYQWDFDYKKDFNPKYKKETFKKDEDGDGNPANDLRRLEYTFPKDGKFKVALRVIDKAGASSYPPCREVVEIDTKTKTSRRVFVSDDYKVEVRKVHKKTKKVA